jgi:hypothetical protein
MGETGFCIWIIVDLLRDVGMAWWLKIILWCAASLVLFDIAYTVSDKIWRKKRLVFALYALAVLSLLITGLYRHEAPPQKPHVGAMARSPNPNAKAPDYVASLTNAFLFFNEGEKFDLKKIDGVLALPITNRTTKAVFRLGLRNDSHVIDEGITVVVLLHTNLIATPNQSASSSHWESCDPREWPEFNAWGIRTSMLLHPDDEAICSDLLIESVGGWTNEILPMAIMIRAKDMPSEILLFWIIGTPEVVGPRLISLKDATKASPVGGGKVHFEFSEFR